jgi:triosephosphate isomerase
MILINFKTYKQSSGENAVRLSKSMFEVSKEKGVDVVACPQLVDLKNVLKVLPETTWVQHVDAEDRGRATGWLPPEIAKEAGATGTLLNHSEHKLSVGVLSETINKCKSVGLKTLVFVDNIEEAIAASAFKPDWIGYEPPELVGSEETSVARSKPDVIGKVVETVTSIPILVGAGVKDKNDVEVSFKLGAKAVGVASAVVKAENQKHKIEELAMGFN